MTQTKTKFKYDPAIYNKTANIFGKIMGKKIKVKFEDKGNCKVVQSITDKDKLTIHLNPFNTYVTGEEVFYSCEEHELAHPLFKSDAIARQRFADGMQTRYREFGIRKGMAENVARCLDDQRIESCWSEIYPGSEQYFKQLRKGIINQPASDLVQMMLAARAGKPELVHPFFIPFYAYLVQQLERVERKSMKAVFTIGHQVIKDYVEVIKQFLNQDKNDDQDDSQNKCDMPLPIPPQPQEQDKNQESDDGDSIDSGGQELEKPESDEPSSDLEDSEPESDLEDGSSDESESEANDTESDTDSSESDDKGENDVKHDESESDEDSSEPEPSDSSTDDSEDEFDDIFENFDFGDSSDETPESDEVTPENIALEIKKRYLEDPGTYEEETSLDLNLDIDMEQVIGDMVEDVLEEAMEEFEKDLQSIEEKLTEFQAPDPAVNTQMPIVEKEHFTFSNSPVEPFPELSQLQQIFRRINTMDDQSTELGVMGELDMDEYIQFMLGNADPDIFIEEKEVQNLNMVLVIDGSSSMGCGRLTRAKRLALTCKRAAEGLGQITVDTWIFSGMNNYTPIKKLTEMELRTVNYNGYTHTNDAVRFVTQQPSYKYQKNIMFLITDGMPQGGSDKYRDIVKTYGDNQLTFVQADTHYALKEARQKGWKIFTFFIDDPSGNSGIFGNPYVSMETERLSDILGYFEKEVKMFLGRR